MTTFTRTRSQCSSRRDCALTMIFFGMVGLGGGAARVAAQGNEQIPSSRTDNQQALTLKVGSNLVVVRVVVRDAQGKPVENLRKEDFRLFDNGKEQAISQFAAEGPASLGATVAANGARIKSDCDPPSPSTSDPFFGALF